MFAKVVARESQNHKVISFVRLVERFESLVLRREPALGSSIHDEHTFSFELVEVKWFTLEGGGLEVVEGLHGSLWRIGGFAFCERPGRQSDGRDGRDGKEEEHVFHGSVALGRNKGAIVLVQCGAFY